MNIKNNDNIQCNSNAQEELNKRIYSRNIPSELLQPYLEVRPASTKYSYFPIVDPRSEINVPMEQLPTYNVHKVFNPGNTTSPWSGFSSHINKESELRNQIFALQKCSQSTYVPASNSDLFQYSFKPPIQPNPHELLFKNDNFSQFNPNPDPEIIGTNLFNNSTRVQIRDLTNQNKC